jgi:hypothetical protein
MLIAGFASPTHPSLANSQQNKILMQPQGVQSMAANTTKMNIVLVHGAWADASSWSKVIPILQKAGHRVCTTLLNFHLLYPDTVIVLFKMVLKSSISRNLFPVDFCKLCV